ncbi:MAG: hypothetical protein FK733_00020, partial [Asgard group archaeon]|nr:hypothetical protein [Asgard group archaeon]
ADWENGLHLYNISTPESPSFIRTFSMTKLRDITILSDYAFVADTDRGMHVFNLTDPTNPSIMYTYSNAGYTARAVAYVEYVLVANGLSGLLIYDTNEVIDPSPTSTPTPTETPTTTPTNTSTPTYLFGGVLVTSVLLITACFTIYLIVRKKRK